MGRIVFQQKYKTHEILPGKGCIGFPKNSEILPPTLGSRLLQGYLKEFWCQLGSGGGKLTGVATRDLFIFCFGVVGWCRAGNPGAVPGVLGGAPRRGAPAAAALPAATRILFLLLSFFFLFLSFLFFPSLPLDSPAYDSCQSVFGGKYTPPTNTTFCNIWRTYLESSKHTKTAFRSNIYN